MRPQLRLPPRNLHRLYAILDIDTLTARGLSPHAVMDAWLDAGIRLIQLRAKSMPGGDMLVLADALVARARSVGATFIVNDRADIAAMSGADGVHVGQTDVPPKRLPVSFRRNDTGSRFLVGLSTHSLAQLEAGLAEPADYLAIGPVFPTISKVGADPVVGLDMVRAAAGIVTDRPLVAIGGITLATAASVLAAGATSVAVISDLVVGDLNEIRVHAKAFHDAICQ